MFTRSLALPEPGTETFFLWGPRQTGKTTLLRDTYPESRWVDLLKADEFRRYVSRPELLRQELEVDVFQRDAFAVCVVHFFPAFELAEITGKTHVDVVHAGAVELVEHALFGRDEACAEERPVVPGSLENG